jgi:hypothetical protein
MLYRFVAIVVFASIPVSGIRAQAADTVPPIHQLQDLSHYVGTYPCRNGLLRSPVLLRALRDVLRDRYAAYHHHLSVSGCGAIEERGDYLLLDVSQLHVGGSSSIILVRKRDGVLFLFWLRETVSDREAHVYGPRPIPTAALAIFEHDMNVEWGHVACFSAARDSLAIDLTRRANQDTGRCLSP